MNAQNIIIDTTNFGTTCNLEWRSQHKNIYAYPKIWSELDEDIKTYYKNFIQELNEEELKSKLIEEVSNGILICTENEEFKDKIRDLILEVIEENEKKEKNQNLF